MHAICANLVTCEASDCHHPATVKQWDRPAPKPRTNEHGETRYIEQPATYVELCEQCDEKRRAA